MTPSPRWFAAGFALAMAAGLLTSAAPVSARFGAAPSPAEAQRNPTAGSHARTLGVDVNRWNRTIYWNSVRSSGHQFAYIKATQGTSGTDPNFDSYYPAAYYAGLIRGAYHFARPNLSSGATQADFFASNGGAWSADNQTLPGAVMLEPNPYRGGYCYGRTRAGMRNWIAGFLDRYYARTGRWAVIATTLSWWRICTGNYAGFANHHPLWIIRWSSSPGRLPNGWGFYTFWQHSNCRKVSGISGCANRDYFNGDRSRLIALANNT